MSAHISIRSKKDRLRYTISFELFFTLLLMLLGTWVTKRQAADLGLLVALLTAKAMIINLLYNLLFDKMDVRAGRIPTQRKVSGRIAHALGLEFSLAVTSLPIYMWWLEYSFFQALMTNFLLILIAMIYTFLFSWSYDHLFPVRQSNVVDPV